MAYDPNFNSGGASKNLLAQESYSSNFGWFENEESLDLSNYITGNQNLELCSDDLFQNLFPPNSPTFGADPKKGNLDHFNDEEVDSWYQTATSEPTSACTSAAPSPVPVNFYNTPPVTPQAERLRPQSPHHLQFDGLTTPMSSSRFASLRTDEGNSNYNLPMRQIQADPQNHQVLVKQEPEIDQLPMFVPQVSVKHEMQNPGPGTLIPGMPTNAEQSTSHVKQLIKRPSPYDTSEGKKGKAPVKGTEEYVQKRQRNNIAVRRSRDKAKAKAQETQKKVDELLSENGQLHKRVAELTNELTTLKGLLRGMPRVNTQNA